MIGFGVWASPVVTFLETAALGAVATPLVSATGMPVRTLGSTGAQVSLLAFGGAAAS